MTSLSAGHAGRTISGPRFNSDNNGTVGQLEGVSVVTQSLMLKSLTLQTCRLIK